MKRSLVLNLFAAILAGILFLSGVAVNLVSDDAREQLKTIFGAHYNFAIYFLFLVSLAVTIWVAWRDKSAQIPATVDLRSSALKVKFDIEYHYDHVPVVTIQVRNNSVLPKKLRGLELITEKQWDLVDPGRYASTQRFEIFNIRVHNPVKVSPVQGSSAKLFLSKKIRPFSVESFSFTVLTDHEANGSVLGLFLFLLQPKLYHGPKGEFVLLPRLLLSLNALTPMVIVDHPNLLAPPMSSLRQSANEVLSSLGEDDVCPAVIHDGLYNIVRGKRS